MAVLQVIAGFVLLLGCAEFLIRGAVAVARRLSISPLVIGMTVVAVGTSAPELVVCLNSALTGSPGIAVGNVVGSNIANVLLILGVAGLISPIAAQPKAFVRDGGMLFGCSLMFAILLWQGEIDMWSGILLLTLFFAFLGYAYRQGRQGAAGVAQAQVEEVNELANVPRSGILSWVFLLVGLLGILVGADLLVEGGVSLARSFGISEEVIGLTLVAIGTSLPELAASVLAAWRGHPDILLGNVIGSNFFNILGVIGVTAIASPLPVADQILSFDLWVMLGSSLLLIPFVLSGGRLDRREAGFYVFVYAAYIGAQAYGVEGMLAGLTL
jgi:cation:H+ antiporter